MQYVNLGRSGLKVSRLCLGTMNFGYVTDEAEAFKIMDESVAQGVNFFDSADVYGGPQKPDIEGFRHFRRNYRPLAGKKQKTRQLGYRYQMLSADELRPE